MTSAVSYILVAMTLTSGLLSMIFFLTWKTQGRKQHALTWSVAFLAATFQWLFNLNVNWFPGDESYCLTVSALALGMITLGLKGHCQRTRCEWLPKRLWPYAAVVYMLVVWTTVVSPHVGLMTATVPATAAIALFLSSAIVWKHRDHPRPAECAAAIALAALGIAQLLAAGITIQQGVTADAAVQSLFQHINYLVLPAGYTGMAMFVIFMMASDLSEEMKEIAIRDQLTGLLNRRGFGEQAAIAYATARRTRTSVSVIMSDIDRFKIINDELGHAAGDLALCHFARVLQLGRRQNDVLARIGGEEFALVLPGTELPDALNIADDLCSKLADNELDLDGNRVAMTASFGVAAISDKDTCLTDVVVRADRALYRSKRAGRNQVDLESSQMMRRLDGPAQPVAG